jgi:hypothetical protein
VCIHIFLSYIRATVENRNLWNELSSLSFR